MSPSIGCLEEHELLELASSESDPERLRVHLRDCLACRARLDKLKSDLSAIRSMGPGSARSSAVATDRDPGSTSSDRSDASAGHPCRDTSTQVLPSATEPWPN